MREWTLKSRRQDGSHCHRPTYSEQGVQTSPPALNHTVGFERAFTRKAIGCEDVNWWPKTGTMQCQGQPVVRCTSFRYQAESWAMPRRIVATVAHHVGELCSARWRRRRTPDADRAGAGHQDAGPPRRPPDCGARTRLPPHHGGRPAAARGPSLPGVGLA